MVTTVMMVVAVRVQAARCVFTDMFSERRHNHRDTGGGWWLVGRNIMRHHWMVSEQLCTGN